MKYIVTRRNKRRKKSLYYFERINRCDSVFAWNDLINLVVETSRKERKGVKKRKYDDKRFDDNFLMCFALDTPKPSDEEEKKRKKNYETKTQTSYIQIKAL